MTNISTKLYSNRPDRYLTKFNKRESLLTGIEKIDVNFNFPYGYYVILGQPGTGKSWFALWLTRVFYMYNQVNSVYFSLEMPEQAIRARILQQWSDLNKHQFEGGGNTEESLKMLRNDVIVVDTFFEDDTSKQTPERFEIMIDEYYKYGYRVFHFDHLHELSGASDNQKNQGVTEVWAKVFQKISKKYSDIWLFIFAQPNGASMKKNILQKDDILGSKSITHKCDYVLSLNRKQNLDEDGMVLIDQEDRNIILYIAKTRYTEKASIGFKLLFDYTGNFKEIRHD